MNSLFGEHPNSAADRRDVSALQGDSGVASRDPHYRANLTCGSLRLRESRLLAALMVDDVDTATWNRALYSENVLQLRSAASIKRVATIVRARLSVLDPSILQLVLSDDRELAVQSVMAGAIGESRLLADFMNIVLRRRWQGFDRVIEANAWSDYIDGCRARDPEMPQWSESTLQRLRSTVYRLLVDAGYLKAASERRLQRVVVLPPLRERLTSTHADFVLRCLSVHT